MNARDTIRYRTAELVRRFIVQLSALDHYQARRLAEELAMSIDLLHAEEKAKENAPSPPSGHPSQTPGVPGTWVWTPEAEDKGTPEQPRYMGSEAVRLAATNAAQMVMAPDFRRLFPRSALAVVLDHHDLPTPSAVIILPDPTAR